MSADTIPAGLRLITITTRFCACGRELITSTQLVDGTCECCKIAHMNTCLCGAHLDSPDEKRMQMCLSCARRRLRT